MLFAIVVLAVAGAASGFSFEEAVAAVSPPLRGGKFRMGETVLGNPLDIFILTKLPFTQLSDLYNHPAILIDSYMHARQPYSLQLMEQLFQSILQRGQQHEVDFFIQRGVFVFYPFVNADGYAAFAKGGTKLEEMRKNGNRKGVVCVSGVAGVDINRNFPSNFGIIPESGFQCSEEYRGTAPFSENEAKVFEEIFQRFKVIIAIDIHSYGNEWIYPYASDRTDQQLKNHTLYPFYASLVKTLRSRGRKIQSCFQSLGYIADGVYIDWALDRRALSLAFEVGNTFHSDSQDSVGKDIERAIKDFFEVFQLADLKYEVSLEKEKGKITSKSLLDMTIDIEVSNRTIRMELPSGSQLTFPFSPNDTQAVLTTLQTGKKHLIPLQASLSISPNFVVLILALLLSALLLIFYSRVRALRARHPPHLSLSLEQLPTAAE